MSQSATEYQVREQMFEALYEDYQKPIEQYLVKWVHDQESARDLCQETFKQFWELLRKQTVVKQYAYYKNRLYLTATHRAIDYLRQNKPIVYLSQSESEANSWFDELRSEGLEDRIDFICTQYDLLQLPPKQREYLVEYALGDKQKEIADKHGISESTVSEYMSKGRTNLRTKKSFVVTADLQERQRVSREIDQCINLFIKTKVLRFDRNEMLEGISFRGIEDNQEALQKIADFAYEFDSSLVGEGLRRIEREVEVLEGSDKTQRDYERYLDRVYVKPMRRFIIDIENQRRGLLSDTAVLGACGQYLF